MKTHGFLMLALGVALGMNAVLVAWLVRGPQSAQGATTDGNNRYLIASAATGQGNEEAVWIFDSQDLKMGVYFLKGRTLNVGAIRDMQYDMRYAQWPANRHEPSVGDMKKGLEAK